MAALGEVLDLLFSNLHWPLYCLVCQREMWRDTDPDDEAAPVIFDAEYPPLAKCQHCYSAEAKYVIQTLVFKDMQMHQASGSTIPFHRPPSPPPPSAPPSEPSDGYPKCMHLKMEHKLWDVSWRGL